MGIYGAMGTRNCWSLFDPAGTSNDRGHERSKSYLLCLGFSLILRMARESVDETAPVPCPIYQAWERPDGKMRYRQPGAFHSTVEMRELSD